MFAKLIVGAAAIMAAALFAYLGDRLIAAYGAARYQSGLSDGQLRQVPEILAANMQAMRAGLEARDRVIAANRARDGELQRLIPQMLSAHEKVIAYAATAAGRTDCLGADRVWGIEQDRSSLFPASASDLAGSYAARPMQADAAASAAEP